MFFLAIEEMLIEEITVYSVEFIEYSSIEYTIYCSIEYSSSIESSSSWVLWIRSKAQLLEGLRLEHLKFKTSLGNLVKLYFK